MNTRDYQNVIIEYVSKSMELLQQVGNKEKAEEIRIYLNKAIVMPGFTKEKYRAVRKAMHEIVLVSHKENWSPYR